MSIEFLNDSDLCRVLDVCLPPRTDAQYLTLWILATGVRVGEISGCVRGGEQRGGIRLSDIRIDNDREMYARIWGEKTDSPRDIAIMPEAVPWLMLRVNMLKHQGEEWLFPSNTKRRPICKMQLQRWWLNIMEEADCWLHSGRRPHTHTGRHTYATWEALRLPIHALQDQLGHKRGSRTTLQYYTTSMVEYRYHPGKRVAWREKLAARAERRLRVV
jgi:integrase